MSVRAPTDEPITLPQQPVRAPPSPFPVMAAMAPVVASVLIWLVTRSSFALIFAALGPVIAIASVIDSRWSSSRRLKKDLAAHAVELDRIAAIIDSRLEEERLARRHAAPGARALVTNAGQPDAGRAVHVVQETGRRATVDSVQSARFGRWRVAGAARTRVVIGTGTLPSTLRVDGIVDSDAARALRERARFVAGVPVEIDAARGIGVVGGALPARALVRGILLQLCNAMGPDAAEIRADGAGWEWTSGLPHSSAGHGAAASVRIRDLTSQAGPAPVSRPAAVSPAAGSGASHGGGSPAPGDPAAVILIVLARTVEEIPTSCGEVLELTGPTTAVLHRSHSDRQDGARAASSALTVTLELVAETECAAFATALRDLAERLGVVLTAAELPAQVGFGHAHRLLDGEASGPDHGSLPAVLGVGSASIVLADIVRDGPHAIVGGTTGSGKSELLTTWIASMALRHSPDLVTFLLVDFKGGSAFAPLQRLPHVVGVITDLDEVAATRALASLSAEIVYRERMLAELGCRDIGDTHGAFPRLVIVVDEFAAMLDGFPDLHALFVDIAARGRSLGMHLILCTQRPTGVVKDSLLANCGLRMSLRVHNRGDSVAVVGTDAAAALSPTQPGRLILASGGRVTQLQVATVSQAEIDDIARRTLTASPPRRPWLDPLPNRLALDDLQPVATGIRLGLADLPSAQRQDTAVWVPDADGSVLVVGASRSGKTTVIDTVTAEVTAGPNAVGSARWRLHRVGSDDEETWDTAMRLAAGLRSAGAATPAARTLLIIDDLDSILARLDDDYATRLRDAVVELLRDGPRRSLWLMVTVQRLAGPLSVLSGFAGAILMLRLANRQEHLISGGESATWVPNRVPGNAVWRGGTVQIATVSIDGGQPRGLEAGGSNTSGSNAHCRDPHGRDSDEPDAGGGEGGGREGNIRAARTMEPGRAGTGAADPGDATAETADHPDRPARSGPARHRQSGTAADYIVRGHALTVMVCPSPQRRMESILAGNRAQPELNPVRVALVGAGTRITVGELGLDLPGSVVLIGDTDDWQAQWALFAALRQSADLVLDGCTVSDYRALTKRRELPPLLTTPGHAWHVPPGGQVARVRLKPE